MEKKSRTGKGEEKEKEKVGSDAKASLAGGKQQQQRP